MCPWKKPAAFIVVPVEGRISIVSGKSGSILPSWFPWIIFMLCTFFVRGSKKSGMSTHSSVAVFVIVCFMSPNNSSVCGLVFSIISVSFCRSLGICEGTCMPFSANATSQPKCKSAMITVRCFCCCSRSAA